MVKPWGGLDWIFLWFGNNQNNQGIGEEGFKCGNFFLWAFLPWGLGLIPLVGWLGKEKVLIKEGLGGVGQNFGLIWGRP